MALDREAGGLNSVILPQPTRPAQMPQVQQTFSSRYQCVEGAHRRFLSRLAIRERTWRSSTGSCRS